MPEQTPFWDVSHQKLDDHEELVYSLVESRRGFCWWGASDRLLQIGVCCAVIQLHSLYTA